MSHEERQAKSLWFKKVLQDNEKGLVRYCQQWLKNLERAQDIVQEAYLRLWKQPYIEVADHVTEWLFTVCRNLCLDQLRKEGHVRAKKEELIVHLDIEPQNVEDQLIGKSQQQIIKEIIQQLKPNQQEVLRLKFQEGMSYHQISRITGHTVTNVGVLIHNTLKKIRELVEKGEQNSTRRSL